MRTEFITQIKDGKTGAITSKKIADCLRSLEGKRVVISIDVCKSTRSQQQNRYLHLLFTIFKDALNDLGNEFTMEEVKELCKMKFATIDVFNNVTGECIGQRIKGTHEMSKSEMVDFIESIIRYSADFFHIVLPYPNENFSLDFDK